MCCVTLHNTNRGITHFQVQVFDTKDESFMWTFPFFPSLSTKQRKRDSSLHDSHNFCTTWPVFTATQWKALLLNSSCSDLYSQLWISVFLLCLLNAVWILCESAFFFYSFFLSFPLASSNLAVLGVLESLFNVSQGTRTLTLLH